MLAPPAGGNVNLWLDDYRDPEQWASRMGWPPTEWRWARSVNEAIQMVEREANPWAAASLDHDLGDYNAYGGDGEKLVKWMIESNIWPQEITVHSSNPVGVKNMLSDIDRYGPYNTALGNYRTIRHDINDVMEGLF
jgi:hypothetical protein